MNPDNPMPKTTHENPNLPSARPSGSAGYVLIWNKDDDGPEVHLSAAGRDFTICGHDSVGDDAVHHRPPVELRGNHHRVTCKHCLDIISAVRDHLHTQNTELTDRRGAGSVK